MPTRASAARCPASVPCFELVRLALLTYELCFAKLLLIGRDVICWVCQRLSYASFRMLIYPPLYSNAIFALLR